MVISIINSTKDCSSSSSSVVTEQLLGQLPKSLFHKSQSKKELDKANKVLNILIKDHGSGLAHLLVNSTPKTKEFINDILTIIPIDDLAVLLEGLKPNERLPIQRIFTNRLAARAAKKGIENQYGDHWNLGPNPRGNVHPHLKTLSDSSYWVGKEISLEKLGNTTTAGTHNANDTNEKVSGIWNFFNIKGFIVLLLRTIHNLFKS